jgi:hypothetical protein
LGGPGLSKLFSRIQHFTVEMNPGAGAHRMTIGRRELEQLADKLENGIKEVKLYAGSADV